MSDFPIAVILILALLLAVRLTNQAAGAPVKTKPPPGQPKGTLSLGQYAVQPGAQWLVLTPGAQ
jgi:hypothetical protein